jgi:hypothetical protein
MLYCQKQVCVSWSEIPPQAAPRGLLDNKDQVWALPVITSQTLSAVLIANMWSGGRQPYFFEHRG